MIIDHRGYTVLEWSDYVSSELGGPIPKLLDEANWQEWARSLISLPIVREQLPPDPSYYAEWFDWAEDFNRAIRY